MKINYALKGKAWECLPVESHLNAKGHREAKCWLPFSQKKQTIMNSDLPQIQ